jgi:hypothetical protein
MHVVLKLKCQFTSTYINMYARIGKGHVVMWEDNYDLSDERLLLNMLIPWRNYSIHT